jgi:hypothetical protein
VLDSRKETITVQVPSGGTADPYTRESTGQTTTTYTPQVVWVTNPKRSLVINTADGRPLGTQKREDAQLFYEAPGLPDDVDWVPWIRSDVVVVHRGRSYVPVAIAEWVWRGWQVVSLRLVEGGQTA